MIVHTCYTPGYICCGYVLREPSSIIGEEHALTGLVLDLTYFPELALRNQSTG